MNDKEVYNIVPCWFASEKPECAARTIRPKINNRLPSFPEVLLGPYASEVKYKRVDWVSAEKCLECNQSLPDVNFIKPGCRAKCCLIFLDGRVSNSFVGCLWCIDEIHY